MSYFKEYAAISEGDETDKDVKLNQYLKQGFEFVINKTWDNKPIDHAPVKVRMNWHFERQEDQPHKRVIQVQFEAPLFDDDPPANALSGYCADLYNYECVEFFFANEKGHYLEVEVGPHGHWLVLLFNGYRKRFNNGEDIELEVENVFDIDKWQCKLEIPIAYLPGRVTHFNAYALHGTGNNRHYEAMSPVTDGSLDKPDFHRKEYFQRIDMRRLIPDGYNSKPFNDLKYGDMWEAIEEGEHD